MSPSPKILAIIQARMASSRLPGKVLLDIAGKPMLQWVVERARMAATVDQVVVATTTDPSDDPVADFCGTNDIAFTRGHPYDVLDRYVQAARQFEADIVVRITADCPLIDPGLVDVTVRLLVGARLQAHPGRSEGPPGAGSAEGADVDSESGREPGNGAGTWHPAPGTEVLDFAANRLPPPWGRTYPIGLDVEVATKEALELAWGEAKDKHYREHVMPYFYDDLAPEKLANGRVYTTPRGFRIAQLHHDTDHGAVRWTVDTPEDLAAVRVLVERLPAVFTWLDALETWQAHPEIAALNAGVSHKTARDVDRRA